MNLQNSHFPSVCIVWRCGVGGEPQEAATRPGVAGKLTGEERREEAEEDDSPSGAEARSGSFSFLSADSESPHRGDRNVQTGEES